MTLKFTNKEHTSATFGNSSFGLAGPEDWDSIGDGPTREAVKAWLAEGNEPIPFDPPSYAEQKAAFLESVRATREQILNRLAGIAAAAIVSGDTETQQGFVAARRALLDITSSPAIVAATSIDELKLAVLMEYRALVTSSPATLVDAFNVVDE